MSGGWVRASSATGGAEIRHLDGGGVVFRSSAAPGIQLVLTAEEWKPFVDGVRAGEFTAPDEARP